MAPGATRRVLDTNKGEEIMSYFNFPSERKPTPPNTPPGSPRTPDEKSVSEKKPKTKRSQVTKHHAMRSIDFKNVKTEPREKRLMVAPTEKAKAWKPGKVSTS